MTYPITTAPAPKKRPLKGLLYAAIGLLIFGLGIGVGSGSDADATAGHAEHQAPTATVTVTSKPEVKEVTKEVVTVPQACLDALDDATDFIDVATDFTSLMSEHMNKDATIFNALSAGDFTLGGIDPEDYDISGDIQDLNARITGNDFDKHSTACKEAS